MRVGYYQTKCIYINIYAGADIIRLRLPIFYYPSAYVWIVDMVFARSKNSPVTHADRWIVDTKRFLTVYLNTPSLKKQKQNKNAVLMLQFFLWLRFNFKFSMRKIEKSEIKSKMLKNYSIGVVIYSTEAKSIKLCQNSIKANLITSFWRVFFVIFFKKCSNVKIIWSVLY